MPEIMMNRPFVYLINKRCVATAGQSG